MWWEILIEKQLVIKQPGVTLCCSDLSIGCQLESVGTDRSLSVTGINVTLFGIDFVGGYSRLNGGNVAIEAAGYHSIIRCSFHKGTSKQYGGGLAVVNADSLNITDSSFESGNSELGGGGLAVLNTSEIIIYNSSFGSNEGGYTGGGLYVMTPVGNIPHTTIIQSTSFKYNTAEYGGGFIVRNLGSMFTLKAFNSSFHSNYGDDQGGAGLVLSHLDLKQLELRLYQNSGEGNRGRFGSCDDFLIDIAYVENVPECIYITDQFKYEFRD